MTSVGPSSSSSPGPLTHHQVELSMDLRRATRHYVDAIVAQVPGMKILLMDAETIGIVSMTYTQSELLERDIFLFMRLDTKHRETMMHLRAIVFVRPTPENLELLQGELKEHKYSEYYLFFNNIVPVAMLKDLARADTLEVVKHVRELYVDYYTINKDLFTLNIPTVIPSLLTQRTADRICEGLSAVLLSLKKKPVVRYQRSSELCQRVSQELSRRMHEERFLFDVGQRPPAPVLLILDRRNDPVTPLLTQWTYQAMVHECIGIHNNRCKLNKPPPSPAGSSAQPPSAAAEGVEEPLDEVVLSAEHDEFYQQNMFLNWGEVCQNIKGMLAKVQLIDQSNRNIKSIDDMKRILENFPQFKQMKGLVSKHVALLEELAATVKNRALFEVSQLEQELACRQDHSAAVSRVSAMLDNPAIRELDRLKLVMLYALRYQRDAGNQTNQFIEKLKASGVAPAAIALVPALLRYAGASQRAGDLFGERGTWMERLGDRIATGLKGVENVFTQHKPLLSTLLTDLLSTPPKLSEMDYPAMADGAAKVRPNHVIVFIVGGATFEEAALIARMNVENPSVCVTLGGTTILNSASFLEDVDRVRNLSP